MASSRAGADPELAVRVAQVVLDGRQRHDEDLGDLAVEVAGGGEVGDPALGRGQRAGAGDEAAARPGARGAQLGERALLERRARRSGAPVSTARAERIAGLDVAPRAPQGAAEVGLGARLVQPRAPRARATASRSRSICVVAARGRRHGAQRDADRPRGAEAVRVLELVARPGSGPR